MEKFRWAEITYHPSKERFEHLSKVLNDAGIPNEFQVLETPPSQLGDALKKGMTEFQQLRIGAPFGEQVLGHMNRMTSQSRQIGACDSINLEHEKWWPRSFFFDGFLREVTTHAKKLDIDSHALIVGSGSAARAVFAGLLKIGYTRFNITDRIEERGVMTVRDLKKKFFNVDVKFVPPSAITTLPGIHSILINATPFVKSNDLLEDLYYFNFFRPGGVVVDLVLSPIETPLLSAAKDASAVVIHGYEIAAWTDVLWSKHVTGHQLDLDSYKASLKKSLEALEETSEPPAAPEKTTDTSDVQGTKAS